MNIELTPIGYVKNGIKEQTDFDWGRVMSEIVLHERLAEGLIGLEQFSHALIVTYLDKANFNIEEHLKRRPRGREDMPNIGIFSQRAKDRPNPIGITAVPIVCIDDNILVVKGLDAIDGTPVIDIKPYFPAYDKRIANTPEWVDRLMEKYF